MALCLGFGCFFAVCPFSALGTQLMRNAALGWRDILLARTVCMISAAVWLFARDAAWLRAASRGARSQRDALAGGVGIAVGALLLYLGDDAFPRWLLGLGYGGLLGFSMAFLGGCWFEVFFAVRRERGRMVCIVAFAGSFLCTVLLTWLAGFVEDRRAGVLVVTLVLALLSCVLMGLFARLPDFGGASADGPCEARADFDLTPYARAILFAFGASWGLVYNMPVELGYGTGSDQLFRWATTLVSCGVLLVGVAVFVRRIDIGAVRFGLMLRWVITLVGILWTFTPVLVLTVPIMTSVAFIMVFWIQLTVLFVFAMEVCLEAELPFSVVLARYFAMFVVGNCVGAVLFLAIKETMGSSDMAYMLIAAVGATVSLVVMPFMPSRGSSANVFTLDHLPEDEDDAERNERARRQFVEERSFTPREAEVFELLMLGRTRDEIATELQISPWTVKNHIRAVLNKTEVHSAKELMALVYGQGDSCKTPKR